MLTCFLIYAAIATMLVRKCEQGKPRAWATLIAIWLSTPVVIVLNLIVGLAVANLADCHPSARAAIECSLYGLDISNWINGLTYSGYAIAVIALPWFLIGGVVLGLLALVAAFSRNSS